jgi:hypothetical protein
MAWTFFTRMTMAYNEEGRYFDELSMTVYKKQSVWAYGLLTTISLILTILTLVVKKWFKK